MPKEHYYGLTAFGPNASKGLEYIYLGCFDDFEDANEMAEFQNDSRLGGFDFIWLSTQTELEALGASIKNHLTFRSNPLSFEP